jgi:hypothetical protein
MSEARVRKSASRFRFGFLLATGFLTAASLFASEASHSDTIVVVCGDATGDGQVTASDAMFTLQAAVGTHECPPPRCDCNDSGSVTAGDAMGILQSAVGLNVALECPGGDPAPTSTTTSTLPSDLCGNDEVDPGEDCDPPGGFCRGGCNFVTGLCVDFMCSDGCSCPAPRCGDAYVDPAEECDPPGSACEDGSTCGDGCGCE